MVSVASEKGEFWERVTVNGVPVKRFVSNYGRVINSKDGKEMLLADNGAGYLTASVQTPSEGKAREYIHRLVATAFIPNPNNLPQVNHIDCDKSNNRVDNLEWISGRDNILDAHKKGRMTKRALIGAVTYLTVDQVIDLYTAVKRDNIGISEKARQMGISRTTASSIINKRSRSDITDKLDIEFAK